jgi:hypothetical protein
VVEEKRLGGWIFYGIKNKSFVLKIKGAKLKINRFEQLLFLQLLLISKIISNSVKPTQNSTINPA